MNMLQFYRKYGLGFKIIPILLILSLIGSTAKARTFTVTNSYAQGKGSLKEAIIKANQLRGKDIIVFDIKNIESPIFHFNNELLTITDDLVIEGKPQPFKTLIVTEGGILTFKKVIFKNIGLVKNNKLTIQDGGDVVFENCFFLNNPNTTYSYIDGMPISDEFRLKKCFIQLDENLNNQYTVNSLASFISHFGASINALPFQYNSLIKNTLLKSLYNSKSTNYKLSFSREELKFSLKLDTIPNNPMPAPDEECAHNSNELGIIVGFNGEVILQPQPITECVGGNLTMSVQVMGGSGTTTVQWQQSADGITWNDVPGETNMTFRPPSNVVGIQNYRAKVTTEGAEKCGPVYTASASATIVADPSVTIASNKPEICIGEAVTINATITGGNGANTLQWQSSADNSTWTDIAGATGSNYITDKLTETTYIRVVVKQNTGCEATSASVKIVVGGCSGVISDFVWLDCNRDGLQNGGEVGIAGVSIILTGTNYKGEPINETTTSSSTGAYRFADLKPGKYVLTFGNPAGITGLSFTKKDAGNDNNDSDADASGKTDEITLTGNQVITSVDAGYADLTAPVFTKQAVDLTVDCNGSGNRDDLQNWLASHGGAVATDNWSKNLTWSHNFTTLSDECGLTGRATVTFTVADECGNRATTTATFIIQDKSAPSFLNVAANVTIDCKEAIPPVVTPDVTDVCDFNVSKTLLVYTERNETGCGANVKIHRIWTITDACNNTATAEQIISIEDKNRPIIFNVPPSIKLSCKDKLPDGTGVVATDICDPTPRITMSDLLEKGTCGSNYKIMRLWTAADACGNTATATQMIEVTDTDAPEITGVPQDVTVDCGTSIPSPTQSGVRAADGCSSNVRLTVADKIQKGACVDNYTVFRTWTATDGCGNITQKTQKIVVDDKKSPELLNVPADITVELWKGQKVPAAPTLTANDNCDAKVDVTRLETRLTGLCGYQLRRTWTAVDNCNNRSVRTQTIVVNQAENAATIASTTPEGCVAKTGRATLSPNTTAYTYAWSDGGRGAVRSDLAAGSYKVTATANGNCAKVLDVFIAKSCGCEAPIVTLNKTDVNCDSKTSGSATLTVRNGLSSDFRYIWSPAVSTTNSASNLTGGTYQVRVERVKDNTCFTNVTVKIDTPSVLDVQDPIVTVGDCQNPIGKVEFIVPSGDSLKFKWPDGDTSRVRSGLLAGTYNVTVTRNNVTTACPAVKKVEIGSAGNLKSTFVINRQPSCGLPNGSVTINTTGGSSNYVYSWGEGNSRHVLPEGSMSVTVTDIQTNCKTVVSFTLMNETPQVGILMDTIVQLSCAGMTDGRVVYNLTYPNGFRLPAKIEIRNASNVLIPNGTLGVGSYTFMVKDSSGCLAGEMKFKVAEPPATVTTVTKSAQTCDNLGSIMITASGGNGNFKYNWSDLNGQPNQPNVRYDLKAGFYTITVTDAGGCQRVVRNIQVVDSCACRLPVIKDMVMTNATCGQNDGALTILLKDGNESSYNYSWSPNVGTPNSVGNSRSGLASGEYDVTISSKTNAGCALVTKVAVGSQGSGFFVYFNGTMEPATCDLSNGQMTIYPMPSETLTYTWLFDGKKTNARTDLKSGFYQVKVTNPNYQCPLVLNVNIDETNPLDAWAVTRQKADCGVANGSVELNADGGSGKYGYSWGTSPIKSDLRAGVYRVTVTDLNWGCKKPVTFSLDDKNVAPATVEIDNGIVYASCPGKKDGKVDFKITYSANFKLPASVRITDGLGREYQNGSLPAGDYCIEVRDASGCMGGSSCFFVREPAPIKAFPLKIDKNCEEGGQIFLSLSGGSGGAYIFNWNDRNELTLERNRDSLAAGTYSVSVYDAKGCSLILDNIVVNDECETSDKCASLVASVKATDKACTEGGKIIVDVKGGVAPFSYDWLDMAGTVNTQNRYDLEAGTYTLIVTDANGCKDTLKNILIKNTCPSATCKPPVFVSASVIEASCGNSDGQITVNAFPSTGLVYQWTPSVSNTNTASKLEGGVYKVRIANANDATCYTERDIVVKNRDAVQIDAPMIQAASCGLSNGRVEFNPNGKLYNFLWSDGKSGNPRSNLAKGRYIVTITDFTKTQCPQFVTVDVPANSTLLASAVIDKRAGCGTNNGQATIRVLGGSGSYSYSWGTSATKSGLAAGNYAVTATDNQTGCTVVVTFAMPNEVLSTAAINISQPIINLGCTGDANGSVVFNVVYGSGFAQPGRTEIRDAQGRLAQNENLTAGKYTIMVYDANNCLAGLGNFEVREPQPLVVSVGANPVTCSTQGSIVVTPSGGSNMYTYKWGDLVGTSQPQTRNNLNSGFFSVTVSDTKGCKVPFAAIEVQDQKSNCDGKCTLDVTATTTNKTCTEGGKITLVVTGGSGKIRYDWTHIQGNNDQKDLINLNEGTYTVFVYDSVTFCRDTLRDIKINTVGNTIGVAAATTSHTCTTKGTITLTISGGVAPYTYKWSDITTAGTQPKDRVGLSAGIYAVTVSDASGCKTIRDNIIIQNNAVNCSGTGTCDLTSNVDVKHKYCGTEGGSLITTVSNGLAPYKFDWLDLPGTDNPQNRYDVAAGNYTLYITDATGCRDTFINLIVKDSCPVTCTPPLISNVNIIDARCLEKSGSITLTMADLSSYRFKWTPSVSTTNAATGLLAGVYKVRIARATDTLCFIEKEFVVNNIDNPIQAPYPSVTDATCGGSNGAIVFSNVKSNWVFKWSDGKTGSVRQGLAAETYYVSITDPSVGACAQVLGITIKNIGSLTVQGRVDINPSCGQSDGQATVTVLNGSFNYTYSWGSATKTNLRAGTYTITVYDNQTGCVGITTVNVTDAIPAKANIAIATPKVILPCRGATSGKVTFSVTYDAGFNNPADVKIIDDYGNVKTNGNLGAGKYYIVVKDAKGCVAGTSMFEVTEPEAIMAMATVKPVTCDSTGAIYLNVSGGTGAYTFDWSDIAGTNNTRDRVGITTSVQYTVTITDANGCGAVLKNIVVDNICKIAKPTRDTVYRTVLANTTDMVCPPTDPALQGYTVTYSQCSGTNSVSGNFITGSITTTGCVDYKSGIKEGVDIICVKGCTNKGVCDTTIFIITVTTNPNLCTDMYSGDLTLNVTSCDSLATACTNIPYRNSADYVATDNGVQINFATTGCSSDTAYSYNYFTLTRFYPTGPYTLDGWTMNNQVFKASIASMKALVDSLNKWDAGGNWVLNTTTNTISGGKSGRTYGTMVWKRNGTTIATFQPNKQVLPSVVSVKLDTGFHRLIFRNKVTNCVDTADINVLCFANVKPISYKIDTTLYINAKDTICLNNALYAGTTSLKNVCINNYHGYVGYSIDDNTDCIRMVGVSVGNDTLCIRRCYSVGQCDTVTIIVRVKQAVVNNCPKIYTGPDVLSLQCGATPKLCTSIVGADTANYIVTVNGSKYSLPYAVCTADTIFSYTYFPLTLSSPTGPYNLQSWTLNGKTYTAVIPNIRSLVDSMNKWDVGGNWRLDAARYTISGGNTGNTYSSMVWTKNGAKIATLNPSRQAVTRQVGITVSMGTHKLVFRNILTGCVDSSTVTVSCQGAVPTEIVRRRAKPLEKVYLTVPLGKEGAYCINTDHFNGLGYQVQNICEPNATDNVNFVIKNNCVIFSGDNVGVDTACLTLCDGTGVCDTVNLIVNVLEEGKSINPIAVNDKATTVKSNEVVIKPMINDTLHDIESNVIIVTQPANGSVTLDKTTGNITYHQTSIDCISRDSFRYAIVNEVGTDTAWIDVEIVCDDVIVYSGFSPNEDGINDKFMIIGLEKYPKNVLMIFNQYGNQVFEAEGYNNQWDGTMEGKPLQDGTYFWILDLGNGRKLSGYVQIHR